MVPIVYSRSMKRQLLFLSSALLTGFMLHWAWPTTGFIYLIFSAFLPLLHLERQIAIGNAKRKTLAVFGYSWLAFAIFNLTTTAWVKNAHISGPIATTFINGALMALVFTVYHIIAKRIGTKRALFGLPFLWICIEVFHQDWDLSFPWLDLGNAFANHIEWVQWYEFTGHMGGTLWVWIVNLLLFQAFNSAQESKRLAFKNLCFALLAFSLPLVFGSYLYSAYAEKGSPVDIVVVQPNIEAFTEKYATSETEQTTKFLHLAEEKLDSNVDILVGPETLLGYGMEEKYMQQNESILRFQSLINKYPNLNVAFGATTFQVFAEADKTPISLNFKNSDLWYEIYNASFIMNRNGLSAPYHKSKLVVAAEQMPFRSVLQPLLGKIIVDLGGMTGTHGTQKERTVFATTNPEIKVATIICWENEFGDYCTEFARNGANIFLNITNDGWWGDSDGHRQHMHYSRLRAVENRRAIARSANTGISCFINQRGDVLNPQPWAKDAVIRAEILANNELTFYSKNGDYIGRIAVFISALMLLAALVQGFLKRKRSAVD